MITEELYKGNDEGLEPIVNIQGYIAGNPLTDKTGDLNSRLEYAYRLAFISQELYEATKKDCKENYANANSDNVQCMLDLYEVDKDELYDYATVWANDENVMKSLNVREGTVKEWLLCNLDMKYNYSNPFMPQYEFNVQSSVVYHERLTKRNCRALIFSGDHDMMVSHVGTLKWINSLNLTITENNWDAYYVDRQASGFTTSYAHHNYSLVFATVKGAGHTAPEFKPAECFALVRRWFARRPI
ncbi:hypothetical protein M8C21_004113 [Ambrosia artemisiifolia]|uniref:Uncharacterized protein n=1 Tax=Ambrosia artemisiifolia TaxID=4212 RepID=A0AAD5CYZ5_AMBAR|nr:hypothetical protein M8C21_004113 [Ambrosia artemisiifolia]